MSKKNKTFFFVLYIVIVCVFMWIPTQKSGIKFEWVFIGIRSDYWIHTFIFIPFLFFCSIIFDKNMLLIHILFGVSFASIMEISHYFIPYRTFSFFDFLANIFGLIIGSSFYLRRKNNGY